MRVREGGAIQAYVAHAQRELSEHGQVAVEGTGRGLHKAITVIEIVKRRAAEDPAWLGKSGAEPDGGEGVVLKVESDLLRDAASGQPSLKAWLSAAPA